MALVTALTLASVGLALGTTEIKRAELTNDPLTLCLWLGDPNMTEGINKPLWDHLDAVLSPSPPTRHGYLQCVTCFHVPKKVATGCGPGRDGRRPGSGSPAGPSCRATMS